MSLRLVHRRLAVLMGLAGLAAFAAGAGVEPVPAVLATLALAVALFRHPDARTSRRLERVWLPIAAVLVARALVHVFWIRGDVVVPVVDLLLLLMSAEALRSLDAPNDLRLYALSFALILASTAYRPGVVFLVAFVAYVSLATVALMVGHVRRQAERHRVRDVPLGRPLIVTAAALSCVTLAVSALVFLTFPRVSRAWSGRGEAMATSIAGFGDEVSLAEHGSRIYSNPQIVLRVEFPGGRPDRVLDLHWRGRSYDHFDGVRWSRSRSLPPSAGPSAWYRERWPGDVLRQTVYAAPLDVRVLFTLHPTLDVDAESAIQPLFDNAGDFVYWGSGAPAYTADSRNGTPVPDELRAAESGYLPSARHYLQLPELPPRLLALADSLTRGAATRYDKAVAVLEHLRSFEYTLELPSTAREATLEHFLLERRAGHCEYFSTAMAVLLRAAGVEARNVNGFLGGEWSQFGEYLAVTQNQAHSWVEVWFPGYGWVTFDPTPGGAGGGSVERAWFWPGRILFDGLQHRWNKWILDYSLESQSDLLREWAGLFNEDRGRIETEDGAFGPRLRTWGTGAALALLLAGLVWARRGRRSLPSATRMYLRLRESCERAGVRVPPGLTPLALLERVREVRRDATRPAERVVEVYLRSRYGGEPPDAPALAEMREALRVARRKLSAPTPPAGGRTS